MLIAGASDTADAPAIARDLPVAGFHAARGEQRLPLVILAGYVASLLDALF